eukprot:125895_1
MFFNQANFNSNNSNNSNNPNSSTNNPSNKSQQCHLILQKYFKHGSSTLKHAEQIAKLLCEKGIRVGASPAALKLNIRKDVQIKWENNYYQCICATIAFGMGID